MVNEMERLLTHFLLCVEGFEIYSPREGSRMDRLKEKERAVEAASGFEPLHRGFADLSLNHLGTPPSFMSNTHFPAVSR
jgi:hypothetical protein